MPSHYPNADVRLWKLPTNRQRYPYFKPQADSDGGHRSRAHVSRLYYHQAVYAAVYLRDLAPEPNSGELLRLFPLCQYSAEDGHHTDWRLAHLVGIISRGPCLSFVEVTAVTANGRTTPEDLGLWKDSQIGPLKKIVDSAHSQGQLIGIQLSHAGRNASTVAPWLSMNRGPGASVKSVDGIDHNGFAPERTLFTLPSIQASGLTSALLFEERHCWPDDVVAPTYDSEHASLLTREWQRVAGASNWDAGQTVRLAEVLVGHGMDVLDVPSGGNDPQQQIKGCQAYQSPYAFQVKDALGDRLLAASVGAITSGPQANDLLNAGLDMVVIGRNVSENPGLLWTFVEKLDVPSDSLEVCWIAPSPMITAGVELKELPITTAESGLIVIKAIMDARIDSLQNMDFPNVKPITIET
ncbi:FMN-linked oxidoreductase [Aspergillus eucalypticola CBS 122712]|uniref:FMN-linked oxidoreductase n=1 Tax=Aspergillus eucalypticola (strain CBS 122712 / IBT 29274) TaxID=1448314 RepID=A0A317WAN8_ASPEC|nr:FMN-linked oxidoreductase [Aspergillus eucalypticola CBS 122712]PWY82402.1 FMN-linked oxidoreductase [Aspergillus eucalypticola CBS 122712]